MKASSGSCMTGEAIITSYLFEFFMLAGLQLHRLRKQLKSSKRAAFAEGTVKNLRWQWKLFIMFCIYFSFEPLPASVECLCLYAQFLSRSFKAPTSIRNYVSGVKTMHVLLDVTYLGKDSIELKLTLKGISRKLPHMPRQASPLSPNILGRLYPLLDHTKPLDCTIWALFLMGFFTMSRKSNLVATGVEFDINKQLCRGDVLVGKKGLLVRFRWSKTNQFGKRNHLVPICAIPGSVLCPVAAYRRMLRICPGQDQDPAFLTRVAGKVQPVSYGLLQAMIKRGVSRLGLDPRMFSSHSLRRAGASWAFHSGVPGELIQLHGDWTSLAYLRYLEMPLMERSKVAKQMSRGVANLGGY